MTQLFEREKLLSAQPLCTNCGYEAWKFFAWQGGIKYVDVCPWAALNLRSAISTCASSVKGFAKPQVALVE
jgi:hypothetical protein